MPREAHSPGEVHGATGLFNAEVICHLTNVVAHEIDAHDALATLPPDRTIDVLGLPFRLDSVPRE